ncbi:MAG: Na/Pi cotransporter family protein [Planctomycetaceae bacterium]|nr:Na/Pi cotransporter family protein [Planctomycetaceae bacterium]
MSADNLAKLVFGLIGGLGIFLLGMKYMSEGMQAVAGSSLRRMIGAVTNNRFLATGVGTLVTTLIQSSSVTTVMVVGFVNSGVMTLQQAIGVIMGANIGTTITGWIIAIKIGKYGLPILGVFAFVYLFSKGDRWRSWAMVFMGIGMVFFGLETMGSACKVIKEVPEFEAWFHRFQADSYLGVVGCATVGCVLTMLVQSSSATLGITITLAQTGVIEYPTAAALVIGENIGTTITAYLATLGATTNARRAAYFHIIFNVLGFLWITAIFQWYTKLILSFVPSNIETQIAATHTGFNIANTLLFISFVPFFTRMLERIVPSKGFKEKPRLTDLDIVMLETPLLAIEQSRNEILKMGDGCVKMLGWLHELLNQKEHDSPLVLKLRNREKILDSVQDEVSHFITDILSGSVPHNVAEECRQQLRLADEWESVSDYIETILRFDEKLRKEELRFTESQTQDLNTLHQFAVDYVVAVSQAYRKQNVDATESVNPLGKKIRQQIKEMRRTHLNDLSETTLPPQVTVAFLNALNAYDRVRDHAQNILQIVTGEK